MELQSACRSPFPEEGSIDLCHVHEIAPDVLAGYACALGLDPATALTGLAEAIAFSPGWNALPEAHLIVRFGPYPLLGILGAFGPAQEAWLAAQARTLDTAMCRLRYAGPVQVEEDCARLALRLREELGERLRDARFVAIPNGGFQVLDRLIPLLGLEPARLSPDETSSLVVVIDDCAFTGARFASFLPGCPGTRIVFAPLYSPPPLRTAVLASEPRVLSCLSASDLMASPHGKDPEWKSLTAKRFWLGQTEHLALPWNEPDRSVWNPWSQRWEAAWRIVPPALCSKNRPAPGQRTIPVHVQPEGVGPFRPSPRTLFADLGQSISLWDLDSRQGFELRGAGSDIWRGLLRHGDPGEVACALAREYDASEEQLRSDTDRLVETLTHRGLMEAYP